MTKEAAGKEGAAELKTGKGEKEERTTKATKEAKEAKVTKETKAAKDAKEAKDAKKVVKDERAGRDAKKGTKEGGEKKAKKGKAAKCMTLVAKTFLKDKKMPASTHTLYMLRDQYITQFGLDYQATKARKKKQTAEEAGHEGDADEKTTILRRRR